MSIFKTITSYGITNQNRRRLTGQSSENIEDHQKKKTGPGDLPIAWCDSRAILKPLSRDPRKSPSHRTL